MPSCHTRLLCLSQLPSWEQAAKALARTYPPSTDGRLRLATVDCVQHNDLCDEQKVSGYPTTRVFKEGWSYSGAEEDGFGEKTTYYGERDTESLVNFATSLMTPAAAGGRRVSMEAGRGVVPTVPAAPVGGCNIEGSAVVRASGALVVSSGHRGLPYNRKRQGAAAMNMTHHAHLLSFRGPGRRPGAADWPRTNPGPFGHGCADTAGVLRGVTRSLFVSRRRGVSHTHHVRVVEAEEVRPARKWRPFARLPGGAGALRSYQYDACHWRSPPRFFGPFPEVRFHYGLPQPAHGEDSEDRPRWRAAALTQEQRGGGQ